MDYAALPVTADNTNENTRAQLARVNYLRDEPGGRRFFVNDLNGPLYILDKQTKAVTTYLDFNGAGGRAGLFPRFTFERNFATGLTNFLFDPDYTRSGVFYTLHMEDPAIAGPAAPKADVVTGLDLSGYTVSPAVPTPTVDGRIEREVVLIEWKDRNTANTTFEGTARELLRVQHPLPQHPLGEMTFNPVARPGDADWRVMYLGAGDSGSGEQRDSRRLNPQRLDTLVGKILRIVPDLREHTSTSTVSENGRYRTPNDNPFSTVQGARKEIWAYGLRNPHRLTWDVDPARPSAPTLLAFNIGLVTWETVVIVRKGANYGYPLREGTQSMSSSNGMGPLPDEDTIPVQISDTVSTRHGHAHVPRDRVPPHSRSRWRCHRQRLRVPRHPDPGAQGQTRLRRHHHRPDLVRRSCRRACGRRRHRDDPRTDSRDGRRPASTHRRQIPRPRREGTSASGMAAVAGRGRVDLRFAVDDEGELYILTKSDGMIRKVVGARAATAPEPTAAAPPPGTPQAATGEPAPNLENPVASTAQSIAAGQRAYDANCAVCHGPLAQGAVKAGMTISIIEEQRGKQPPDLTDDQWDHGSRDGDIFAVIKRGLPPTMMPGYVGRIPDDDIWSIVNYLRTLQRKR